MSIELITIYNLYLRNICLMMEQILNWSTSFFVTREIYIKTGKNAIAGFNLCNNLKSDYLYFFKVTSSIL